MMFGFFSRWNARSIMNGLEQGKFARFMDSGVERKWFDYCERQASIPHNREIVLRVTINKKRDPWYLWAIYEVVTADPVVFKLNSVIGPAEESAKLKIPDELADRTYFSA